VRIQVASHHFLDRNSRSSALFGGFAEHKQIHFLLDTVTQLKRLPPAILATLPRLPARRVGPDLIKLNAEVMVIGVAVCFCSICQFVRLHAVSCRVRSPFTIVRGAAATDPRQRIAGHSQICASVLTPPPTRYRMASTAGQPCHGSVR
jgi:hypothetical protein